jgi:hypothetical protein
MKQDKNNIEKILQSLDGIGSADVPDFFYIRLQARMENELLQEPKQPFLLRPVFLTTCLLLILTVNIFTLRQINSTGSRFQKQAPATIESFSKKYNIDNSQLY